MPLDEINEEEWALYERESPFAISAYRNRVGICLGDAVAAFKREHRKRLLMEAKFHVARASRGDLPVEFKELLQAVNKLLKIEENR